MPLTAPAEKLCTVSDESFTLRGRCVAIPETRQLDVLAGLLERRGAAVVRCPLVSILDVEDATPVEAWLQRALDTPFDDLILLTGEGLRRLLGVAERRGWRDDFVRMLEQTRTVTRGPKPAKALRELGLKPGLQAGVATTPGIIDTLREQNLQGRRVGVQLYGQEPNLLLQDFLRAAGAQVDVVAPYRYANAAEAAQVEELVEQLVAGEVDAICFTSSPQVGRLLKVAAQTGQEVALRRALTAMVVAAVGPVVADALREADLPVHLMPESSWFMKPLVQSLVDYWND